ncbi:MAG: choice-of-anchor J domain-containing protein [Muribaculaceae bacterium]|nr:choice-of-anchor J domain-containing protein [Muribaculaceae bacterium]
MKRINQFVWLMLMAVLAVGCNDDFDVPPLVMPQATHTPNMTIADFKAQYWNDARNFCDTVKEDVVIHGYVSANDETGNIYKYLFIQDETGGIGLSVDASSTYTTYRVGQEVVINMKDRWIGKYNGQYLIGQPEWYAAQSVWEAGRMPLETLKEFVELNGLPKYEQVLPVVTRIADVVGHSDRETQLKYQGQLVKFQNVKWDAADGVTPFATADATTNRTLTDGEGHSITVANSNYADFRAEPLPLGTGDVVGVLQMTGSDQWKLVIRYLADCIGFENSTKGTINDPYTVAEAIERVNTGRSGWMTGYVVGAVAPEVTEVTSNSDIEWKAPTTLANTLVVADNADVTDFTQCVMIELPQGSKLREQANLHDNVEVYKTQIWLQGEFATVMGMNGIKGNTGSTGEFRLSVATGGLTTLNENFEGKAIPSDWGNKQIQGDKAWYTPSFDNNYYAAMTGYRGNAPFESWLITPALDIKKAENKILTFRTQVNGYGSTTTKFEVYVLSTDDPTVATRVKLNPVLATPVASGYSSWAESGNIDLSAFDGTYYIGFVYSATADANYATWCLDDVKFNVAGGSDPNPNPEPGDLPDNRADFETMNGGSPKSSYGSFTSTLGWTATNCNLLIGGTDDNNPTFKFIGLMPGSTTNYAMAVTINGHTEKVGTIVSPVISTGMTKLRFDYGIAYTDTKIAFRVEVNKPDGSTAWTKDVTLDNPEKFKVYNFEESVDVTGEFTIKITNLCPSQTAGNKDRVSIWNLNWDKK